MKMWKDLNLKREDFETVAINKMICENYNVVNQIKAGTECTKAVLDDPKNVYLPSDQPKYTGT